MFILALPWLLFVSAISAFAAALAAIATTTSVALAGAGSAAAALRQIRSRPCFIASASYVLYRLSLRADVMEKLIGQ